MGENHGDGLSDRFGCMGDVHTPTKYNPTHTPFHKITRRQARAASGRAWTTRRSPAAASTATARARPRAVRTFLVLVGGECLHLCLVGRLIHPSIALFFFTSCPNLNLTPTHKHTNHEIHRRGAQPPLGRVRGQAQGPQARVNENNRKKGGSDPRVSSCFFWLGLGVHVYISWRCLVRRR